MITQRVGGAWDELEKSNAFKDTIIRSFKKCGISSALDSSKDHKINISGITDYTVGSALGILQATTGTAVDLTLDSEDMLEEDADPGGG